MHRHTHTKSTGTQRLNRIELIARVQVAYEQLRDALDRARRSPRAKAAVAPARHRLHLLNRALALIALEAATA